MINWMKPRTQIKFTSQDPAKTLETISQWAKKNSFRLRESKEDKKLYKRGYGFLTLPIYFGFKIEENHFWVETWVQAINPLESFFMKQMGHRPEYPIDLKITGVGVHTTIAQTIATKAINKLLKSLNQPLIQRHYPGPSLY